MDPVEPVAVGEEITYTIQFASNGPARGVVITDVLSSNITDTQVISSGAAITETGVPCYVWQVQDLAAGQSGVITITAVAQAERFLNTASVRGTSPDPNLENNSATVMTHMKDVIFVDQRCRRRGTTALPG